MLCKYCKVDLVSPSAYEDNLYSILISWLNSVTCIKWYRFYPEFRRPDDVGLDEQYGMILISSYEPMLNTNESKTHGFDVEIGGVTITKYCLAIDETETIEMQLSVFRENGDFVRADQSGLVMDGGSASDVLKKINIVIPIHEYTKELTTAGVTLKRSDKIDVVIEKRHEIWEWQSTAIFRAHVCRMVSFPINDEELIYCVETCDGKPVCTPKCEDQIW